jgi:hypothetical protein
MQRLEVSGTTDIYAIYVCRTALVGKRLSHYNTPYNTFL